MPRKKSLAETHPYLLEEWDYRKNQLLGLDPNSISFGSGKKPWWKCSKGHSWEALIHNRTRKSVGCPYCASKKAGYGNDLLTNHPELCEEWDFEKNKLGPENYFPKSNKKVWWRCSKGHSWLSQVKDRQNGNGCHYCSNQRVGYGNDLLTKHPELCLEWDYDKNKLGPENYTPGSNKKVWWKCKEGHSWKTSVVKRVNRRGCHYCCGYKVGYENDLLTNHPKLCEEWDYEKNKPGPEKTLPGSEKKVWWKCSKGHSWRASISGRVVGGSACYYCSGYKVGYGNDLLTNHPDLCKQWDYDRNTSGPEKYSPGSHKKVWWKCSKEHVWFSQIRHRSNGSGCPECGVGNVSKISQEWLDELGVEQREIRIEAGGNVYYVDGFDPKTNTVYEFFGDYWHGNPKIFSAGKNTHNNKSFSELYKKTLDKISILKNKYNVVHIWENDYVNNRKRPLSRSSYSTCCSK